MAAPARALVSELIPRRSSPVLRYLLAASILANIIGIGTAVQVIRGRGGVKYLRAYLDHDPSENGNLGLIMRKSIFEVLPPPAARPIVFVGDSLTAHGEWRELFGNVPLILNRGIGGDTSKGVLDRLPQISRLRPRAVFLMIGTNDAAVIGFDPPATIATYRAIIAALLKATPDTVVYAESVLPSRVPKFNRFSEEVNRGIRLLADGKSIFFIDLRQPFYDADRMLSRQYSDDGLHLNGSGYLVWKQAIDPIIQRLSDTADSRLP